MGKFVENNFTDPNRFLNIIDDPRTRLLIDLQDLVSRVTTNFWAQKGVRNLHLPITTNTISSPMGLGSDSLPVKIQMFGMDTYLADSMQFMLEYGCRLSSSGAWYLMPSFRGEASDQTHLNQFFHSEAEIPGRLNDVMAVAEEYVRALSTAALDEYRTDLAKTVGHVDHIESMVTAESFPRLTLDEALNFLGEDPRSSVHHEGGWRTLTRFGERRLISEINPFVWVTHFDRRSVPFYQAHSAEDGTTSLSADLLFGVGETVGCGERHTTGAEVRSALSQHGVPGSDYAWYIAMKDSYPMLTSGFGLGVERWLMWVLDHDDIRDMQLVQRVNGVSLTP